jgi:DNA-binding beta-propeller fold protein YncE
MAWLVLIAMLALALAAGGLVIVGSPNPFTSDTERMRAVALLPTDCPTGTLASGTIATVAGTGQAPGLSGNGDGGPAIDAGLNTSLGSIAVAADGSLYLVAISSPDIRRVAPDGTLDTFAGPTTGAPFSDLRGVALDDAGDVYVADSGSSRIWKIDPSGTITPVVGSGEEGRTGDGGPALDATIVADSPIGVGPDGRIYLSDLYRYRTVGPDGIIQAFAGTGEAGFSGDGGPALEATFGEVIGVTPDRAGNVYLADTGNQRIRRVDPDGVITTVAGTGKGVSDPVMIAVDERDGSIYYTEHHGHRVQRVAADGTTSTVAGTGEPGFSGDCGPATEAMLDRPWGIAIHDGVLYVVDMGNRRIRMIVL